MRKGSRNEAIFKSDLYESYKNSKSKTKHTHKNKQTQNYNKHNNNNTLESPALCYSTTIRLNTAIGANVCTFIIN